MPATFPVTGNGSANTVTPAPVPAPDSTAGSVLAGGHEQVVFCQDPASALQAIIAVYSTALGPALGGVRFHPYPSHDAALTDVLRLSEAMAYKAACAGLDLGGGKAVIIGDPATIKSEPLLRAFGRYLQSMNGRYYAACDVGTYVEDMDIIAHETRFVTGRSVEYGGAGDSGIMTALGVFQGIRAAAEHRWGRPTVSGRRVGVAGLGKVGGRLVEHLLADGARVTVADVDAHRLAAVRQAHPEIETLDPDQLTEADLDLYAPCALGGALDEHTVARLQSEVVCGGANNQLATAQSAAALTARGILYAPDYVVNAGGLIQVADEVGGYSPDRVRARVLRIYDTTRAVLRRAQEDGSSTVAAADAMARARMIQISRLRSIWLPGN